AIEQAGHPQPAIYPLNLEGAAPKDYEEMGVTLQEQFGRLDGLLHNAAFLGSLTPIEHYDVELWYRVLQVNLTGPFMLTRACLGLLKRSSDASVVFTSDEAARAYWGAYGVSKHAIDGLMRILADELEANTAVRVNGLDPGPVRTALRRSAYPAEDPGGLPDPEAVVDAYLYLMGPDSRGITGRRLDARGELPFTR
ncbi:MAG: SDR family oxidoreductase, partial [Gammaproteobacteria bacterium]|nr:SDR family oxidoreductase [Gammaproteobacteria bacterium]NIR28840.1 SDR family oxidoreductase [Gammaproteobacteria bacterium]NIR97221.1 SDR family oxidoreductase [Gammaproteobacteria bacterium]NIT62932.1 SDR family oxidoreductase [Gammaproteobacteria bacterium]NIV20622.1 SDR family oxidoreductase [Gammaproteobacteria bacterium]